MLLGSENKTIRRCAGSQRNTPSRLAWSEQHSNTKEVCMAKKPSKPKPKTKPKTSGGGKGKC
jgi:hypothetical protein